MKKNLKKSKMEKINWSNVFNTNHKKYDSFVSAYELAKSSEYPYMLWNDQVFFTSDANNTGWVLENGMFVDKNPDEETPLFV